MLPNHTYILFFPDLPPSQPCTPSNQNITKTKQKFK